MKQRKLRLIKPKQANASEAYGITIPPDIALFYPETYFTVKRIDKGILLISGTKYNEIKNETAVLEDFKV